MRILIVKTSSLGDIIQAFPVLDYIKECSPACEIDWVVEQPFAELVQAHPLVNRTLSIQTKKWRSHMFKRDAWKEIRGFFRSLRQFDYDVVIDLQGNCKSGLVTLLAKCPLKVGFGFSTVPERPNLLATHRKINPPKNQNIRSDYLYLAKAALDNPIGESLASAFPLLKISEKEKNELEPILERLREKKGLKILVCPGSYWNNKQLTMESLESFLECIQASFDSHFVFIWGNLLEKEMAGQLTKAFAKNSEVINRLTLPALQNFMSHVDLIISMDSLPLHLSGTTNTRTYSVFGASSAAKYKPFGKQTKAFQGTCPYGRKFEKRCPILRTCKTGACIKNLTGKQLFQDFIAWWENKTSS